MLTVPEVKVGGPVNLLATLRNGRSMPMYGIGTSKNTKQSELFDCLTAGIKSGIRLIDTAAFYNNEETIGEWLRTELPKLGLKREHLYITTKMWPTHYGRQRTQEALRSSLEKLGCKYVDLYLLHWPGVEPSDKVAAQSETTSHILRLESWRTLEEAVDAGLIHTLGVSNFMPNHLDPLIRDAKYPPAVNQVELHPKLQYRELQEYCKKNQILMEAYSPLGAGALLNDPTVVKIAEECKKTPALVLIRWSLQSHFCPIPKSSSAKRTVDNNGWTAFELSPAQMKVLNDLDCDLHLRIDPRTML